MTSRGIPKRRTQRGAIGLAGLFFILLGAVMVQGVIALARTMLHREGMQDAADASAFSSALLNAQGINLLVVINLIMAALVAVLVAIRLAQTLCIVGSVALYGLAVPTWGATLPAAAVTTNAATQLENAFNSAKKPIFTLVEGLHMAQRATAVVVPFVAMGSAMLEAADEHPPAEGAFALPTDVRLPVEADEFSVLCAHATELAVELATKPLSFIPGAGLVLGAMADVAKEIGGATSSYLCGDGTGEIPTFTRAEEEGRPRAQGLDACVADPESAACTAAQDALTEAQPDPTTGECSAGRYDYDHPCEARARDARHACAPGTNAKDFSWQAHSVEDVYQYREGIGWEKVETKLTNPRLESTAANVEKGIPASPFLCKPALGAWRMTPTEGDPWNVDSGARDLEAPNPLCRGRSSAPAPAPGEPRQGRSTVTVRYEQVTRLLGCTVETQRTYPLAGQGQAFGGDDGSSESTPGGGAGSSGAGSGGSGSRKPHRVKKDLALGDDAFQIRSIAFGPSPNGGPTEHWIHLLHPPQGDAARDGLNALSGLALAQSEYYLDHDGSLPPGEWLWTLKWTARLRRITLPNLGGDDPEGPRTAASTETAARDQADVEEYGGLESGRSFEDACQDAQNDSTKSEAPGSGDAPPRPSCNGMKDGIQNQLDGIDVSLDDFLIH